MLVIFAIMCHMHVHFQGNEEAPAELALGEGGEENNSAGTCQLSAEIKGENLLSVLTWVTPCLLQN